MNEYGYDDIYLGMEETFTICVTQEMMDSFRIITGDCNPLHTNESFAQEKGFADKVVYGMLTASFFSTLAGIYLPGKYSLIYGLEVEFPRPVFVGDTLTVSGVVTEKSDLFHTFMIKVTIRNDRGQKVCRGKLKVGVNI